MKDGKCTKRYPRQLIQDTQTGEDGYPLYRRRSSEDGGFGNGINFIGCSLGSGYYLLGGSHSL